MIGLRCIRRDGPVQSIFPKFHFVDLQPDSPDCHGVFADNLKTRFFKHRLRAARREETGPFFYFCVPQH